MPILDGLGLKLNSKPFCTPAELTLFKKSREGGAVTFFRTAQCKCGVEIPKSKTHCSKECWEKATDGDEEEET